MHCSDNSSDRIKGAYWERCFCKLAARNNYWVTPFQLGNSNSAAAYSLVINKWNILTLPDIVIWNAPGQYHEIKHKSPTYYGLYGLEKYRFNALLEFTKITSQPVLYTIHNHALNGGTDNRENYIEHWFTANILELDNRWAKKQENGVSWVNGIKRNDIEIYYWDSSLWQLLKTYWENLA